MNIDNSVNEKLIEEFLPSLNENTSSSKNSIEERIEEVCIHILSDSKSYGLTYGQLRDSLVLKNTQLYWPEPNSNNVEFTAMLITGTIVSMGGVMTSLYTAINLPDNSNLAIIVLIALGGIGGSLGGGIGAAIGSSQLVKKINRCLARSKYEEYDHLMD